MRVYQAVCDISPPSIPWSGLRINNGLSSMAAPRSLRAAGRRVAKGGGVHTTRMVTQELAEAVQQGVAAGIDPAAIHLAFADQGSNLAGKFFQSSLLPYLGFLYFLKNGDKNRVPELSFFGFQFLLLFVIATIPTGIISKTVYGVSLADVDWLHGSAEALLTGASTHAGDPCSHPWLHQLLERMMCDRVSMSLCRHVGRKCARACTLAQRNVRNPAQTCTPTFVCMLNARKCARARRRVELAS